jgi:histidinol-phosphate aminotransferase
VIEQRPHIQAIPGYKPGKSTVDGWDGPIHKLSSNENPYPPLPSVIEAMAESIGHMHRYPNMAAPALTNMLADRYGVTPNNIAFGGGSVEVAAQLIRAFAGAGDEVMYAWRSFEAYPILTRSAGATPVEVPLTVDLHHDLPAMLARITDRTRVIFICTPNNPTGTVVDHDDLREFIARVPKRILVVVDEAYVHFQDDPTAARGPELFREFDNVAVLHTFSKAYGLAGLRLGYAIVHDDVAEGLRKVAMPFAVTDIAQAAGVASLNAEAELQARVDTLIEERARVTTALTAAGWPVTPSQANFIWLDLGEETDKIQAKLARGGIIARPFSRDGIRISIGAPAANDAMLAAIGQLSEHVKSCS